MGPVVKTPHLCCKGHRFDLWLGGVKTMYDTWCGQKKNFYIIQNYFKRYTQREYLSLLLHPSHIPSFCVKSLNFLFIFLVVPSTNVCIYSCFPVSCVKDSTPHILFGTLLFSHCVLEIPPYQFLETTYILLYHKSKSVQFSHSVVSNSLQPHGLQHARPPYPRVYSNSCSLSL